MQKKMTIYFQTRWESQEDDLKIDSRIENDISHHNRYLLFILKNRKPDFRESLIET